MKPMRHRRLFVLLLSAALSVVFLLLTACVGTISSMKLLRTQGTVNVWDGKDNSLEPKENLGIYSGYHLDTQNESYAWIDLDREKLGKLDQQSAISVIKKGKNLGVEVSTGSFYFNVAKPLRKDETMNIRTSSMVVGIRGTCGWVVMPENGIFLLYLLEGQVECSVTPPNGGEVVTQTVEAGHYARMTSNGTISVMELVSEDIPDFVWQEIAEDEKLMQAVQQLAEQRDPMDEYADVLARALEPNDSGFTPELLFADRIDFEADGSPELLMCVYEGPSPTNGWPRVTFSICRAENGVVRHLLSYPADLDAGEYLALAESNGRMYLHTYYHRDLGNGSYNDLDIYYGSWASQDGDIAEWEHVDELHYSWRPGYDRAQCERIRLDESPGKTAGPLPVPGSCSLEEYEAVKASYTDVRILATSPDGVTVTAPEQ